VTFFFDAHFAPGLARALRATGIGAEHVREVFPDGADDPTWIRYAGQQGHVIFTADRRIRTRKIESLALTHSGVSAVFVLPGVLHNKQYNLQIAWFFTYLDKITEIVGASPA
jgi:predicted nuclease of predicted toxin-antitoxin system